VFIRAFEDGQGIVLEVADTGIGIPKECIPQLFQEFYRVKTKETQEIPGTGLGLVICRRIITELGGFLEVKSEEGRGTAIVAHFPVAAVQTEAG